MDEILFRGKSIDSNTWVYGFYCRYGHVKQEKSYIIPEYTSTLCVVEIVRETLGQYIGLTDRYDVKIFEGDIVNILTENGEIGIVKYDEGGFGVEADGFAIDFRQNIDGAEVEVIGNIYNDPELIKIKGDAYDII